MPRSKNHKKKQSDSKWRKNANVRKYNDKLPKRELPLEIEPSKPKLKILTKVD